jgi:methylated-DNA-[protein]-cysteine S-methyltransferase
MSKTPDPLKQFYMTSLQTNFGWMRPISDGNSLVRLDWNQTGWLEQDRPDDVSRETKSQLQAFFSGHLQQFALPLAPIGKSTTGRYWLNIMAEIPYGTVVSYAEFARFAGKPRAARVAGLICANNPIPIIYPCHRVIRTDGKLGGYGAGSYHHPTHANNLARKAALIKFESY